MKIKTKLKIEPPKPEPVDINKYIKKFRERFTEMRKNSFVSVKSLLEEEWKLVSDQPFPADKENSSIYFCILYKKVYQLITDNGEEVPERFAKNYNRAVQFLGSRENSINFFIQDKLNQNNQEDNTMGLKINLSKKSDTPAPAEKKAAVTPKKKVVIGGKKATPATKKDFNPKKGYTAKINELLCLQKFTDDEIYSKIKQEFGDFARKLISIHRSQINGGQFKKLLKFKGKIKQVEK